MHNLSIIVPLFNEAGNVTDLCRRIGATISMFAGNWEVILVNDGSSDGTEEKLVAIVRDDSRFKAVMLRRNFGQTAAIMAGIDHSSGDIIITMDGDLQNDPADIPRLIEKLSEGYDVCSGWRQHRRDNPLTKTIPSKIANRLISLISGVSLRDYGCTLKAYRREVVKDIKLYGEMHRFIPIYASWQGAKVTEIPVTHHPRLHGKSHYGLARTFKVILDLIVVKFLASYSQKPIYVFGGFGLLNFSLAFGSFALMVYFKYWGGKSFIQTPLPQLVILFFLMGFMSLLMGLIAEIQMRTYYESQHKSTYLVRNTINFAHDSRNSKVRDNHSTSV
jgi:glycosyltransferase involved in cell wall biosynthesis